MSEMKRQNLLLAATSVLCVLSLATLTYQLFDPMAAVADSCYTVGQEGAEACDPMDPHERNICDEYGWAQEDFLECVAEYCETNNCPEGTPMGDQCADGVFYYLCESPGECSSYSICS